MEVKFMNIKLNNISRKFKARFYKYIIVLSYLFSVPILKFFLIENIHIKNKNFKTIWYLDYKRSTQEIEFLIKKNFNLLLTDILFIKEIILFLDKKKISHNKPHTKQ